MDGSITSNCASGTGYHLQPRLARSLGPPSLEEFDRLCSQTVSKKRYPLSSSIEKNVPLYHAGNFDLTDASTTEKLADEWYDIIFAGPGVFVLKGMYENGTLIQDVNRTYNSIIESEKALAKGDHFGKAGANDRIWNSFEKHGRMDPESFIEYYSNPFLSLACQAWLSDGYKVTSQVNVVKPGGAAQSPHRDYHLGFLDEDTCAKCPIAMQVASQHLTLQGAIAHSTMPVQAGTTRLLPFSQMFAQGYLAYRLSSFQDYFSEHWVSLPLDAGDGIFFNPALFHAAGSNETESLSRIANLIQASSAFGKPMELIKSMPLIERTWPALQDRYTQEGMSIGVKAFIAAVAEGYSFPTNLDKRPPQPNGMAPESEQDLLRKGLEENWSKSTLMERLEAIHSV